MRWILSHVLRYKGYLFSFLTASLLTSTLFSAVPALTGRGCNEALNPTPCPADSPTTKRGRSTRPSGSPIPRPTRPKAPAIPEPVRSRR